MHLNSSSISNFSTDTAHISKLLFAAKALRHKNTDSGIQLYQTAFIESKQAGFTDGLAKSLIGLGLFHMDKGDYHKSLAYYELAKPFCQASTFQNGVLIVGLYNNIAALYGNRGISDTAAHYYYKALAEMERKQIKDTNLLLLIYSNLGGRLVTENQLPQAKYYLEKGKIIAEKTDNAPMIAKLFVDLGSLYGSLKQYNESRLYAHKALEIFKKIKDPASEIVANCVIGNTYLEQNQPQKAILFFRRALSANILASKAQQAIAYRGLGACYYALKNYKKAEYYYLVALQISKNVRLNKGMIECYKALVAIYTDLGNYKLALDYRNDYAALQDSTINIEKINAVNQLEVKYRTSQKDKELVQKQLLLTLQKNKIRQQNILIAAIAIGALLLVSLLGTVYRSRRNRQKLQLLHIEKDREVTQLKAMMEGEEKERARIARELHDGIMVQFSSAQMNLSALIDKGRDENNEFEKILEQLEDATKELRKSAHNLMPDMLLEEGLAEATHYFCKTLQRSISSTIGFHLIGKVPSIAPLYELMIYRIIQELLQNTIKHAKAEHILVQLNCQDDMISIVVEDNGLGFDEQSLQGYKGMGIKGIKSRIKSLNGRISITTKPGNGTSIYIELETKYLQQINSGSNANYSSYN